MAAVFPALGAEDLPDTLLCKTEPLSVVFTVDMDGGSINNDTVLLVRLDTGERVGDLRIAYDETTRTAVMDKTAARLANGAEFVVTLTKGVMDAAGNPLPVAYSWNFTISGDADPVPCVPAPPLGVTAHGWDSSVTILWDDAPAADRFNADSFNIYRSTTQGVETSPANLVANVPGAPFTDPGVENTTLYDYVVKGVNSGGESESSAEASTAPWQTTTFRMNSLDLRDPHMFVPEEPPLCNNSSNADGKLVSNLLRLINKDNDGDGLLDLSRLLIFRPFDTSQENPGGLSNVAGDCTYPSGSTVCGLQAGSFPAELIGLTSPVTTQSTGVCLGVIEGTTSKYSPGTTEPGAGGGGICWASGPAASLTLDLGIIIPLSTVQVAAEFGGSASDNLTNGLLRGFLPQSVAETTLIPDSIPEVGGKPLSSVLRGGGDCSGIDDRDRFDYDKDGNLDWGWWFYFNFGAEPVNYTGP